MGPWAQDLERYDFQKIIVYVQEIKGPRPKIYNDVIFKNNSICPKNNSIAKNTKSRQKLPKIVKNEKVTFHNKCNDLL